MDQLLQKRICSSRSKFFPLRVDRTSNSYLFQRSKQEFMQNKLSYDIAVIQWITSCHKNRMNTRVITLWRVHATSLTTSVPTLGFLTEIKFILKAIKSHLKGQMVKRVLHSWSFHMKCMKLAEGSFHKFHMKSPLV